MIPKSKRERRAYIPELHTRHKSKYTLAERVYLARYYDKDGEKMMAAALERPIYVISQLVSKMKKNGEWDLYRSLTEDEYEKIEIASERRKKNEIHRN